MRFGHIALPYGKERIEKKEMNLILEGIVDLQERLNELEAHMTECGAPQHHVERCLLLEQIACAQERQAEIETEHGLLVD